MSFAFRLERVLAVRRLQEDAAQQAHAQALERLARAEARLALAREMVASALEELDRLKHADELTAEALYLHSLHMGGLRREVHLARVERAAAAEAAETTGAALRDAHRAREALEKLRERDEAAWRKEQARRETKQIDELAVSRHRVREEENHGP